MFTLPLTTKTKPGIFQVLLIIILMSSGLNLFAQQPLPANNDDLDNIIQKVSAYTTLARQCASFDCPDFDCDQAQKVFNNLRDARKYMRYVAFWYDRASETRMTHFLSLANEGQITADQIARVQWIVDMQETTKVCAGAMLDIAGGLANVEELLEDITKVEEMDIWEKLLDLSKTLEVAKDFEQVLDAYSADGEEPLLDIFNMDNEVINDLISYLSDFATVANEVRTSGGSIKNALKNSKSRVAFSSIIGRFLKSVLEDDIKERKKYIQGLINDLNATNFAQSSAFDELQRMKTLKYQSDDAFNALDDLIVLKSETSGGFTRCLLKSENNCPLLNFNYVSPVSIPDQYQIFNIRDIDAHRPLQIGGALRYFNAKLLNEIPNLLTDVLDIKGAPAAELSLGNTTFEPGEAFDVGFTVSPCFGSGSWAGIVPYDTPRGNEIVNRRAVIGLRSLVGNKTEGTFNLKAPEEEGYYDVRLNNSSTGDEVKSITITVEKDPEVSGNYIKMTKPEYMLDEEVAYGYGIQLEGNLQGRQTSIVLAKAGSGTQQWLSMSPMDGDVSSGTHDLGKLDAGSYEVRLVLMVPPNRFNGQMFEDDILAKAEFEVVGEDIPVEEDVLWNKSWVGLWNTSRGDLNIEVVGGKLYCKRDNGALGYTLEAEFITPDKARGTITRDIDGKIGEFEWEIYNTTPENGWGGRTTHFRGKYTNNLGNELNLPWTGHKNE